MHNTMTVSY